MINFVADSWLLFWILGVYKLWTNWDSQQAIAIPDSLTQEINYE